MTNPAFPISTNGKAFVDANNNRFMVQGVGLTSNFQVNGTLDLLADANLTYMTNIVLPLLQSLNVNMIRVYQVDYTLGHELVMSRLATNGIGVMVELVTPAVCINRIAPVYSPALYQQGASVVAAFQQFDNTVAFSVGNEVVFPGVIYNNFLTAWQNANPGKTPDPQQLLQIVQLAVNCELACAAVEKSFIRDMKAYMSANSYRAIPVGMAMQDGPQASLVNPGLIGTDVVAEFYACGDPASAADYIGINTYRYINTSVPGPMNSYDGLANEVLTIPIPVFLTESTAVNPPYPRDWAIVDQMYSEALLYDNLSGQVAFEFFENTTTNDNFGLYNQPTNPTATPTPTTLGGASSLATQFAGYTQLEVPTPATSPSACPTACAPALLPNPAPNITVTVMNYATVALAVVQNGTVMANLAAAASPTSPSSTPVQVCDQLELYILEPEPTGSWPTVCTVAVSGFADGDTILNNVPWGGACNVTSS